MRAWSQSESRFTHHLQSSLVPRASSTIRGRDPSTNTDPCSILASVPPLVGTAAVPTQLPTPKCASAPFRSTKMTLSIRPPVRTLSADAALSLCVCGWLAFRRYRWPLQHLPSSLAKRVTISRPLMACSLRAHFIQENFEARKTRRPTVPATPNEATCSLTLSLFLF